MKQTPTTELGQRSESLKINGPTMNKRPLRECKNCREFPPLNAIVCIWRMPSFPILQSYYRSGKITT